MVQIPPEHLDHTGGIKILEDLQRVREELNDEDRPMRMRLSRVGGFHSEEIAASAPYHLEPGTVVVSDALGCFAAVKQVG